MAISFFRSAYIGAFCTKLHFQSSTQRLPPLLKKAPMTANCVCQPLGQGFPTVTSTPTFYPQFHRQGATGSLHGCRQRSSMQSTRMRGLIIPVYLHLQLLITLSNLPFLFPWWFMILPTNLLCPSSCRSPLVRCCRESADVHKPLVQTSSIDRTPHLTVEPFLSLGN